MGTLLSTSPIRPPWESKTTRMDKRAASEGIGQRGGEWVKRRKRSASAETQLRSLRSLRVTSAIFTVCSATQDDTSRLILCSAGCDNTLRRAGYVHHSHLMQRFAEYGTTPEYCCATLDMIALLYKSSAIPNVAPRRITSRCATSDVRWRSVC